MRVRYKAALLAGLCLFLANTAESADWPTHRHDNGRSGVTAEKLDVEKLSVAWTWESPAPPQPAWPGPAKWDAYANIRDLSSMRNYDPVFHVSAAGGDLYFGSSIDDAVHCLDAGTGKEKWRYTTDGPVRLPPSVVADKLFFGSDDGRAYCITRSGEPVWKFGPKEGERLVINNGRMISFWPVRTGVAVDGGTAYFAASMLPWHPSYLCAVDAATGKPEGDGRYVEEINGSNTFEGATLVAGGKLIVPQGRISPLMFDRATGKALGALDGAGGGCFVVLTADNQIVHGPGNRAGQLIATSADNRAKVAAYPQGKEMVVAGDTAVLMKTDSLTAMDRQNKKQKWQLPGNHYLAIIANAENVFAGGLDEVVAYSLADGKETWRGKVRGKAHGLAIAGGALIVSTDEGLIYCFRPGAAADSAKDQNETAVGPTDRDQPAPEPAAPKDPPAPVADFNDPHLVGRWVFQAGEMRDRQDKVPTSGVISGGSVLDRGGKLKGTIVGEARVVRVEKLEAVQLDGTTNSVLLAADHKTAGLPSQDITVEAWVRVDAPLEWGGILSAIQDNGNFERGFILGYTGDKFAFGVNGTGGRDAITYLASKTPFTPGGWHHVAGTYDGKTLKVFVDGELQNSANNQQGEIKYPPQAFVEIGAYHDQDEYFRMKGMIHEVRLYSRALSEDEVAKHHAARADDFPR